jgi:hypothetical protein
VPFLKEAFGRLFLPREIASVSFDGEHLAPHSIFSVRFDRSRHAATIRPVWDGADYGQNIRSHVDVLAREGIANIFANLDLGVSWQGKLTPALLDAGFEPVLLLPYAGRADVVIFKLKG